MGFLSKALVVIAVLWTVGWTIEVVMALSAGSFDSRRVVFHGGAVGAALSGVTGDTGGTRWHGWSARPAGSSVSVSREMPYRGGSWFQPSGARQPLGVVDIVGRFPDPAFGLL